MPVYIKPHRFVILSMLILFSLIGLAQNTTFNKAYLDYIEKYYPLAQQQQAEFGIPASIKLAQGLLESGGGNGTLAQKSNNHFGIKCKDWTGDKVSHDDDLQGECFRKYTNVVDSYKDHSLFLKNRKHYAFLFELKPTDYKAWAYGLKKAGYATDPSYPTKLITLIETYKLYIYDTPLSDKQNERLDGNETNGYGSIGSVLSSRTHELYKVNGVKFIVSVQGDTYTLISQEFELSENRIRLFNDVDEQAVLRPGMRVYLSSKKKKAPKPFYTHRVLDNESMHSISQDYGVMVRSLYDLNMMAYTEGVMFDQLLKLR